MQLNADVQLPPKIQLYGLQLIAIGGFIPSSCIHTGGLLPYTQIAPVEVPSPLSTVRISPDICSVTSTFDESTYLTYKSDGGGGIGALGEFS